MAGDAHITFIGNEGVFVESGAHAVMVDALFGDGVAAYTTTPRAVVDAVETARTPFDAVDVALATHFHPDHFNAHAVRRHLEHNAGAHFVSTPQSLDLLHGAVPASRVHALAPAEGERTTLAVAGVRVDAFGLSHGKVNYGAVEHVGFVVYLGDVTVLHLGDGIISERALAAAGVLDESLDAAFLPFWYLTYPPGQRLLSKGFRARIARVFAVHIPPAHERRLTAQITAADPTAIPLVTPLSRHRI